MRVRVIQKLYFNLLILTNFYISMSASVNCSHHGETSFIECLFRKHEVSPVQKYLFVFLIISILGFACVLLEQFLVPKQARWFGKFMLNARAGRAQPCLTHV